MDELIAKDDSEIISENNTGLTIGRDAMINNDQGGFGTLDVIAVDDADTVGAITFDDVNDVVEYRSEGLFQFLNAGETATDSFVYTVEDDAGFTARATFTIVIEGANDAPTAQDDALTVDEDTAGTAAVLGNDLDVDAGDVVSVATIDGVAVEVGTTVTLSSGALVTLGPNGALTYDPNEAFEALVGGDDSFDVVPYTVRDKAGATSAAELVVKILGRNDVPTVVDPAFTIGEDAASLKILDLASSGVDPDTGQSDFVIDNVFGITEGSVTFDATAQTVEFAPAGAFDDLPAGATRDAFFEFILSNTIGETAAGRARITVQGANDAPTPQDDTIGLTETAIEEVSFETLLRNDTDPDVGDVLTISAVSGVTGGVTVTLDEEGERLFYDPGTVFWSLEDGESAVDSFKVTVKDASGATTMSVVNVDINGQGGPLPADTGPPEFDADDFTTITLDEDSGPFDLTAALSTDNADAGENLRWDIVTPPASGVLTGLPNAQAELDGDDESPLAAFYTPNLDFFGEDLFKISVTDGVSTDTLEVKVTVNPINDAPRFVETTPVTLTIDEDAAPTDLTAFLKVVQVEADETVRWTVTTAPSLGEVSGLLDERASSTMAGAVLAPTDVFYAPSLNANGVDQFVVRASDGLASEELAFTVIINPVNDAPTAVEDRARANENEAVKIDLLENDFDVDGDAIRFVSLRGDTAEIFVENGVQSEAIQLASGALGFITAQGDVIYDATGAFDQLARGEEVTDSFNYVIEDASGLETEGVVTVTVVGENDAPVVTGALMAPLSGADAVALTPELISVSDQDADPEDVVLTVTAAEGGFLALASDPATLVTQTTAAALADGQFVFAPTDADVSGGGLTFTITDGAGASVTASLVFGDPPSPTTLTLTDIFAFANRENGGTFFTPSAAERDAVLAALPNFDPALADFRAVTAEDAGMEESVPVFRLFNTSTNTHFYTTNQGEVDFILANGLPYRFEGTAFGAFAEDGEGLVAVRRFFEPETGVHVFVREDDVATAGLSPTAQAEGDAFFVFDLAETDDDVASFAPAFVGLDVLV